MFPPAPPRPRAPHVVDVEVMTASEAGALVLGAATGLSAPALSFSRLPDAPLPLCGAPPSASPRRTRVLAFTCNVCGTRSQRRVNPEARASRPLSRHASPPPPPPRVLTQRTRR